MIIGIALIFCGISSYRTYIQKKDEFIFYLYIFQKAYQTPEISKKIMYIHCKKLTCIFCEMMSPAMVVCIGGYLTTIQKHIDR